MSKLTLALLFAAGALIAGCKSNEAKPEEPAPAPAAAAATAAPEAAPAANSPAMRTQDLQETPIATQNVQSSREQLKEAVKATNDFVSLVNNAVEFSLDDDTGITVVKVIDKNTKEVVRQIPSEEMLAIAKALDTVQGLLVRQKA